MSLFLVLIGSPGRAVKSPNGPWGLNEPWSLGSPGTLIGLALSALTEGEKCRALEAGLAPSQSQHWGAKGVAPSCSVPVAHSACSQPGATPGQSESTFTPDSRKDRGNLDETGQVPGQCLSSLLALRKLLLTKVTQAICLDA